MKKLLSVLLIIVMLLSFSACGAHNDPVPPQDTGNDNVIVQDDENNTESDDLSDTIDEDGWYYSVEEVALYIVTYGHLPGNYITKKEAKKLGWEGGSVEKFAEGRAIGGDHFGNYEGLLPENHNYTECDIDTLGKSSRGAKRIIFSDDGLIYYTDDHYESFELIYGEE